MLNYLRITLTIIVVLTAIGAVAYKYFEYLRYPWTRDGQVRANIVQVAPRVSAPIVDLPIVDNQFVRAGDLLFEVDRRTFVAALDRAQANYDETLDDISALEKQVEAAEANVAESRSAVTSFESQVKAASADLEEEQKTYERIRTLVEDQAVSIQRGDIARANYEIALANMEQAEANLQQANNAVLQAIADLARAKADLGAPGDDNAQLRAARAQVEEAALDLEFTRVEASVDGYVTNLDLRLGSQVVANQPALALVDVNSYWIDAYFRETLVGKIRSGDRAVVTLMSYPDTPIEGIVESIGWGIAQQDGSTGWNLLPSVNPTFEWIRLAQRVPVLIRLEDKPDNVELRVGTTASVLVVTRPGGDPDRVVSAAPWFLQ